MVANICNPGTWEVKVEPLRVPEQDYMVRFYLKKKINKDKQTKYLGL